MVGNQEFLKKLGTVYGSEKEVVVRKPLFKTTSPDEIQAAMDVSRRQIKEIYSQQNEARQARAADNQDTK